MVQISMKLISASLLPQNAKIGPRTNYVNVEEYQNIPNPFLTFMGSRRNVTDEMGFGDLFHRVIGRGKNMERIRRQSLWYSKAAGPEVSSQVVVEKSLAY